jgi:hypothetical protein
MKSTRSPRGYWLFILVVSAVITVALIPAHTAAQSNSQVRIVRLSFVEGTVTMYRPDADQWAKVFVNTPIQQGFKIATDSNSFAEVEFENGSTARLGQSSELDFTNLSLSPEGNKINHLTLAQGYATFVVAPEKGDVYQVSAGGSTFDASSKSMYRIDLDQSGQRVEVFKGDVGVRGPYGSGTITKNQVLALTPGSADPYQVSSGISEDAWDQWVNKRQQTETVASNGRAGLQYSGDSLYGWNDLAFYGAWNYLPGYGSCWSPMLGAGWVSTMAVGFILPTLAGAGCRVISPIMRRHWFRGIRVPVGLDGLPEPTPARTVAPQDITAPLRSTTIRSREVGRFRRATWSEFILFAGTRLVLRRSLLHAI